MCGFFHPPRTAALAQHFRKHISGPLEGKKPKDGRDEGGCGVGCRLYDMRHTFATRFALAGGSLPVLAKILGHADLSLLMRYVHPAQADMDRAMEWYSSMRTPGPELEKMLLKYDDGKTRLTVGPGQLLGNDARKAGPNWPN